MLFILLKLKTKQNKLTEVRSNFHNSRKISTLKNESITAWKSPKYTEEKMSSQHE